MEFRFKMYTGKYSANTKIFLKNMLGGYKMESYIILDWNQRRQKKRKTKKEQKQWIKSSYKPGK